VAVFGWVRRVDWKLVYNIIGLCTSIGATVVSALRLPLIRNHLDAIAIQSVFTIALVASAWLLFQLRQSERGFYAVVEIAFGILAGVYAANQFYAASDPDTHLGR
jgi:hypothetical protein